MKRIGRQKHFQANPDCPVFDELCAMVRKTVAMAEPVRQALSPLAERITLALIYGSVAKGADTASSDIALLVVSRRSDPGGALHSACACRGEPCSQDQPNALHHYGVRQQASRRQPVPDPRDRGRTPCAHRKRRCRGMNSKTSCASANSCRIMRPVLLGNAERFCFGPGADRRVRGCALRRPHRHRDYFRR